MAKKKASEYEEQKPLTKKQLAEFTAILEERQAKIVAEAADQLDGAREEATLRMSDEVDLASAEYDQAFVHRMRDREKGLLKKITKALVRIEEGEYDECESCGNYIGAKRLSARPEANLCIECKEEQEMVESKFHKEREMEQRFPFK
jgi:DnaK suppressor protein